MLAAADIADIAMAPAADMFEMGVELQVLKRGTMFAPRAKKLYSLYTTYPSLDAIPDTERIEVEQKILGATFDECWETTKAFWNDREPAQVVEAEQNPRHKMALTFRSYLGLSSRWSIEGATDRRLDYQIWCGPAMGAFNAWTAGTFLADPANRQAAQVARNMLEGAAAVTRAHRHLRIICVKIHFKAAIVIGQLAFNNLTTCGVNNLRKCVVDWREQDNAVACRCKRIDTHCRSVDQAVSRKDP